MYALLMSVQFKLMVRKIGRRVVTIGVDEDISCLIRNAPGDCSELNPFGATGCN